MTLYAYSFPRRMARRWMAADDAARERILAVNVRDESEAYILTALVPGLKAEDLTVHVLEDIVTIEGKLPENSDSDYLLQELPSGSFRRELRLPAPLNAEKVEAHIADGILTIRLPKAESARPHSIKVVAK